LRHRWKRHAGAYSEGAGGGHAPNRRLSKFFYGKPALLGLFSLPENSVDLKYAKNALAAGDPTKGAHDASPDSIVGWPPSAIPTPLGTFGGSILAPSALSFCASQCKILAMPLETQNSVTRYNSLNYAISGSFICVCVCVFCVFFILHNVLYYCNMVGCT